MTYHNVARHLAAEGRDADSTLVHMSPGEVRGLQALAMAHGGSLTINPSTGLPEAGFLSNILPMIAGAALAPLTGGLINPMTAGLLIGGGTALATGDLRKGISAGLGAYGGAGLGAGLLGAGAGAASTAAEMAGGLSGASAGELAAAQQGAMQAAQATPFATMGQGLSNIVSTGAEGEAARSAFMSGVGGLGGLAKKGIAALAPAMMAPTTPQPSMPTTKPLNRLEYEARPIYPTPSPDVPGYKSSDRDSSRQRRYFDPRFVDTGRPFVPGDFVTTTPMPGMAEGGAVPRYFFGGVIGNMAAEIERAAQQQAERQRRAAPSYEEMSMGQDFGYQTPKKGSYFDGDSGSFTYGSGTAPIVSTPTALSRYTYESTPIATSGAAYVPSYEDMDLGQDFGRQQQYFSSQFRAIEPPKPVVVPEPAPAVDYSQYSTWATGGATHLGDYSDGGRMLRGPGDGVSDSIPATIGGKQPARLADGEFVVPARIVSELGNGSSEAGARKLYAMMDRIQNARSKTIGKKRIAVDSKSEKLLPA
jgi:hypothetical protein